MAHLGGRVDAEASAVLEAGRTSALALVAAHPARAARATGSTVLRVREQVDAAPAAGGIPGATALHAPIRLAERSLWMARVTTGAAVVGIALQRAAHTVAALRSWGAPANSVATTISIRASDAASATMVLVGLCEHAAGTASALGWVRAGALARVASVAVGTPVVAFPAVRAVRSRIDARAVTHELTEQTRRSAPAVLAQATQVTRAVAAATVVRVASHIGAVRAAGACAFGAADELDDAAVRQHQQTCCAGWLGGGGAWASCIAHVGRRARARRQRGVALSFWTQSCFGVEKACIPRANRSLFALCTALPQRAAPAPEAREGRVENEHDDAPPGDHWPVMAASAGLGQDLGLSVREDPPRGFV